MGKPRKTIIVNFVARHSYLFVLNMVKGLAGDGCRVIAIVSKNMPELDQWKNIKNLKLIPIDGYSSAKDFALKLAKYFIYDAPRIRRIAEKYQVDVIYLPVFTYWSVFINKSLSKYKYIYMMHDPIAHDDKLLVHKRMNYDLGTNAYKLIILSKTFIDVAKETYKKAPGDILVIPSGYENVATPDKSIVSYDDSKINFLFQGRVSKYKGLDVLAKAYKKLSEEFDNITLTVAGSGDFSEYQEVYQSLPNCTVINRWLSNDEVSGLFNDKSVITILPYTSATQSGVVNVAMPCGSPIIATRCGGIMEQIEDGVNGYLIAPGDAEALYEKMRYVIQHQNELDAIRENGYKRMRNLSWDALAQKVIDAI